MDGQDLESRVGELIAEGNYIGAYGRVGRLGDADGMKAELTGRIANAIALELQSAKTQGSERQAYLRAQLAWVCRDVPGLSYLYREQLRQRQSDPGSEILKSLRDLAEGRPADAADRVRREFEGVQQSIASGEAADRFQGFLKDAGRAMSEGAKRLGSFFESATKRGESIRQERDGGRMEPPAEEEPTGTKIRIDSDDGPGGEGSSG